MTRQKQPFEQMGQQIETPSPAGASGRHWLLQQSLFLVQAEPPGRRLHGAAVVVLVVVEVVVVLVVVVVATHCPFWQVPAPPWHELPEFVGVVPHVPLLHTGAAHSDAPPQRLPQPPQLVRSPLSSTQRLLQQLPLQHWPAAVHGMPCGKQAGVVLVVVVGAAVVVVVMVTHCPLAQVWPAAQQWGPQGI